MGNKMCVCLNGRTKSPPVIEEHKLYLMTTINGCDNSTALPTNTWVGPDAYM
jgi:hypothetical protein